MKSRSYFLLTGLILALLVLSTACNIPALSADSSTSTPIEAPPTHDESNAHGLQMSRDSVYPPPFASYQIVDVSLPSQFQGGGYSLPIDLLQVQGLENYPLSADQQQMLSTNGFVVLPPDPNNSYREFYQVYENLRYESTPTFVTTDAVYHVYHLIFDKMLRDLERENFIPALQSLTSTMLQESARQYESVAGTSLEEPALRNVAFFGVAARLLELSDSIPNAAAALVDSELALINAQQGTAISPIWDRTDLPEDKKLIEDYSQYIVRGHYTLSPELGRYFKTMIWYGRMTFRLRDDFETQRALLLTEALHKAGDPQGTSALQLWQDIYEPTAFIVGKADDLSYIEYGNIADQIYGENPDLIKLADENLLAQFKATAEQLPAPQINSMWVWIWEDRGEATQGFRFMGQRFTLDAYVFGELIWRKVGTADQPRDLPRALDIPAAMGSEEALNILNDLGENSYANYNEQMAKIQDKVSSLEVDSWTQNVYWSWLYSFRPLIRVKNETYPEFMRTQAWSRKEINTLLGSYTELKHDTILYAKQVMAEMGGGPGMEVPPHGYVEPNPEAYARLYALCDMTYQGLNNRNMLSYTTKANLENLMDLLKLLQSAAERELIDEQLTEDEYWRLQFFGGEIEALTIAAADKETEDNSSRDLSDMRAALVADVATGMGRVLEEATGNPTPIYVILPDQPLRVALGAVYTYYEFQVESSQRMTDETWHTVLDSGSVPDLPTWTDLFVAP